jgi:CubicO group peptidase (beta-lactamase class C family)
VRSLALQVRPLMTVPLAGCALLLAISTAASAGSPVAIQPTTSTIATIQRIAQLYADDAVQSGAAVGVEIGVVAGDNPPQFVSAGSAVDRPDEKRSFGPDLIFQIGSISKVFTTNLMGQAMYSGTLSLDDELSSFEAETGQLPSLVGEVTLKDLGDFTGGFPTLAPLCDKHHTPGCLPSARPSIEQYTAQDFIRFFQHTTLPVTTLPAPYNYSDFSVGLLGLLLGDNGAPLSNEALSGWFSELQSDLLDPLSMTNTYLFGVPSSQAVVGYDPALATAIVKGGHISEVKVVSPGSLYSSPPTVTITGGGGVGASAVAKLNNFGGVARIKVTNGGSGYIAPAKITFHCDGSTENAQAALIVQSGRVVVVNILDGGAGYVHAPTVTIMGGRYARGADATGVAHIANGSVTYVSISQGGSGYVTPLAVVATPDRSPKSKIPIWAPAGALSASLADMVTFAAAALGHETIGTINVPPSITQGFEIAEKPYACTEKDPSLAKCHAHQRRSALAWSISPADPANDVGETIQKNGGVYGFSSQVELMPARDIAVVVLVNTRDDIPETGTTTREAGVVCQNVMFALFYNLPP